MEETTGIFSDDGKIAAIPSLNNSQSTDENGNIHNIHSVNNGTNLISHGVEDALKGETVKSILIPEEFELLLPNYLLDFRRLGKIRKHQLSALSNMIDDNDGDTALYVMLKNGLAKLGMIDSCRVDTIMLPGMKSIFGDDCMLYQDVERGKPLRELRQKDVKKIRLRI